MAVVAIVDTGVNTQHLKLRDNLWVNPLEIPSNGIDDDLNGVVDDIHGFDVITGQPIAAIGDPEGHGSHVAGIVTQTSNAAEIMAIRLLDENGSGNISDAINAWSYALLQGATVINNSWGALGLEPSQVNFMEEAIDIGEEVFGAVFVAAAGNESVNTDQIANTPSNANGMISVGASNKKNRKRAKFSNVGRNTVDLFAPGVNISSVNAFSTSSLIAFSGTSMAAPIVAGAAAILQDRSPDATPLEVKSTLISGVKFRKKLKKFSVAGGVLSDEFTKAFTRSQRQQKSRKIKPYQSDISSIGKKNFTRIVCVLDQPSQNTKMDIWNELIDHPFTKDNGISWPEAYENRICILEVEKDYQSRFERKSAIRSIRKSGHFESVEWDRTIGIQLFNEANIVNSCESQLL